MGRGECGNGCEVWVRAPQPTAPSSCHCYYYTIYYTILYTSHLRQEHRLLALFPRDCPNPYPDPHSNLTLTLILNLNPFLTLGPPPPAALSSATTIQYTILYYILRTSARSTVFFPPSHETVRASGVSTTTFSVYLARANIPSATLIMLAPACK